jgi:ATP-dependent protease ClpP protease subunit
MVHQGTTNVEEANTHDLKAETIETLKTSEIYEKILLDRIREKHPKFPAKKLRAMLDKTTYFSSQAALDLGLIDEVT